MSDSSEISFSKLTMDAAETRRESSDLEGFSADPKARLLLFKNSQPAIATDGRIFTIHPSELDPDHITEGELVFLGLLEGQPVFAASVNKDVAQFPSDLFAPLRMIAGKLDPMELSLIGRAKSVLDWHKEHGFCANCGAKSFYAFGGLRRDCMSCSVQHFPRINPVVIMLILSGDKVLLGRGPGWPEGAMSTPAGFVSPGETIEEAVYREVLEETGIKTKNARYLFSQPWPFPGQLMLGMACDAESEALNLNTDELEFAQWYSKDEVEAVFARVSRAFRCPPPFALAHQLLHYWITG